ncbi:hypothetical protein L1887_57336 [Cichorium endivia]|nr:hypothetical protein L1887_57336 [Cichorium endivia]
MYETAMRRERSEGRWLSEVSETHSAHAAHAAHTAHATHATRGALLLGCLDDAALGGGEQRRHTASVLESGLDHLERVEDAGGDHVLVLADAGVVAVGEVAGLLEQTADDDRALLAGVLDDGARRTRERRLEHRQTQLLVKVGRRHLVECEGSLEQRHTTAGQHTGLDSSTRGVERIVVSVLLLAHLHLGRAAHLDHRHAARKLGQTLLQLGAVVLGGGGVVDGGADLLAALRQTVLVALAVEEDGVLLGDGHGTRGAEHLGRGTVELGLELVREHLGAREDAEIAEDALAVVAEAGRLDGRHLELATQLVEDAGGERLAVDVLGDDEQRAAELCGGLERRQNVLERRDLLLREQDERLLELDLGGLDVGDKVRGDVAAVEAHALGDLDLVLERLALLDGDDALLADLLHGGGDELADVLVAVGRDGGDLGDLCRGGDGALVGLEELDHRVDTGLDTATEVHGVAAGSDVLDALCVDGAGEHGGGGGAVTSDLVGLVGDVLDEARAEVLELVLERDGLGDGDTVLGDLGAAEGLLDDHIATLGTEGDRDGVGEQVDAVEHGGAAVVAELDLLVRILDERGGEAAAVLRGGLAGRGSGVAEERHDDGTKGGISCV